MYHCKQQGHSLELCAGLIFQILKSLMSIADKIMENWIYSRIYFRNL